MPLGQVGLSGYSFTYDNWGANPGSSAGTAVTPGNSNVEGAWTQVASSANIAQDCYWLHIAITNTAASAANRGTLLDIGVDPAGGTSYTAVIADLVVGNAGTIASIVVPKCFLIPIFIKAGSSVAVRMQNNTATGLTARAACRFWGQPDMPEAVPVGSIFQVFGSVTGSGGQSFTPGNAADGSWADLGATNTELWWWQFGYQIENTTITAEYTHIEVAYGDSTNKHIIQRAMHGGLTTEVIGLAIDPTMAVCSAFRRVPAGANIYVRGRCNNAPDTGYTVRVLGVGG